MQRLRNLNIAAKLSILVTGILAVLSVAIIFTVHHYVTKVTEENAIKTVTKDLELGLHTLDNKYPGNWEERDGLLYKGDLQVNENYHMVDEIAEITGGTVTIFHGDTRVTTNVELPDGERAIGTQASDIVIQTTLEDGENFYGEANVAGELTQTAYEPIKDVNGNIIGMWYVGESQAYIESTIASIINMLFIVLAIGIIVAIGIVVVATRKIKRQIDDIGITMEKAGEGDFTTALTVGAEDEIGLLAAHFNSMRDSLRNLLQNVSEASTMVNNQSEELTQSSNDVREGSLQVAMTMEELASGSELQAKNASDLLALMRTFATEVDEANQDGKTIQKASSEVLVMTGEGSKLMEKSMEQMEKIDQIVHEAVGKVEGLDVHAQKISALVEVIQDIAEQTNLLALNAAIEAARAGEYGQGFAVVADEVRKLAEESSVSVTNITEIVNNIQNESSAVAESLQMSYQEVEEGTTQIATTGKTFEGISAAVTDMVENITRVSDNLANIVTSSEEMNNSIQGIASVSEQSAAGVEQTSASSQQTSSAMEEVAASSNELATLAEELNQLVQQFKLE